MSLRGLTLGLGVTAMLAMAWTAMAGDASAARGRDLFQEQCSLCHAAAPGEGGDQGPPLNGVVGRPSGAVPGFAYSKGLQAKAIRWTAENLDVFLTEPAAFAPGTAMSVNVADAQDRADLIAFLATTK